MAAVSALVESDMALAAAVLKAVNSSMYGIRGRVQSVHQALNYLGTREVVAVAFELGLRAVFPSAPELDAIWERATVRGFLMGRLAQALGQDAWAAHSAGLFEECGKAVLFKHASERYRSLLAQASSDEDLLGLEHETFGVSHDALGAALCETWGLAAPAVHSVRYHTMVQATRQLPMHVPRRVVCMLSAVVHCMLNDRSELEALARALGPQADLDGERVWQLASALCEQMQALPD